MAELTPEEIEAVRQELLRRAPAGSTGVMPRLARAIEWGVSVLHEFRKGRYWGNNQEVAAALKDVFERTSDWRLDISFEAAIRGRVNELLGSGPIGEATRLAEDAGISRAALSLWRRDQYGRSGERIARKLAEALRSREVADAILSGKWEPKWLLKIGLLLLVYQTREDLDKAIKAFPNSEVFQIWLGPEPHQIHFVSSEGPERTPVS